MRRCLLFAAACFLSLFSAAQATKIDESLLSGLKFRSIGPAVTSGRVSDLAVNPVNPDEYYVAAASGGVWKTTNGGNTFEPIFENYGSFSIGCLALDPHHPATLWVGTGENNSQRSVAYGDGLYKSEDGGKSFKKMGLENSEHIGKIIVHPHNSNIVYVAAQGPLWSNGGDRGLYKTTDAGKTWKKVLNISQYTGVSDIALDPSDPEVIYATSWQRRRHVYTFIAGGPESKLYKSTNGGETWQILESGLPAVDMGRIAVAVSPVNPAIVYCMIEAANKKGGFFRSTDRGASWEKMNDYATSSNYYQEIFCDPKDAAKVYAMDTYAAVTTDGGRNWRPLGERYKHVDNHAIWVNPANTAHMLVGCDGGLYETKDGAATWNYKPNLSITQFYRVTVDNSEPFYYVYGGTQDNTTLGGPSRTTNNAGIANEHWFVTTGGDGFKTQVDPVNPNIVYSQSQYGGLVRFDKLSGEQIGIKPLEGPGEPALRWNWDSPLIISPHQPERLYFAANRLFRSDDRGNTWTAVSSDLSQQIDRNKLPVMDRIWSMDAVAKNQSTSIYGNIVSLDESPRKEGLLYVGTDDGLIQVSENGGTNWRKIAVFPGIPKNTYVSFVLASAHNENVVYAVFNNHQNGDFKPYILKSSNKGASWVTISGNLPAKGSVYCIAEDHLDPNLLFCGTEFGVFFSNNGGTSWNQLKSGLPVIAIRDIAIQKRENDLVLASFGRGFYILDDYSPLRHLQAENLGREAYIFPVKDALSYIEAKPLGLRGKAFMGENYFTAENPPVGAVFTYHMKEGYISLKEKRQKDEAEKVKLKQAVNYPSFDEIRAEDNEEARYLLFTVSDENGQVIRKIKSSPVKGINRIAWDFRHAPATPATLTPSEPDIFSDPEVGRLVLPGKYFVSLSKVEDGRITDITGKVPFNVKRLSLAGLKAQDSEERAVFEAKSARLQRAALGASNYRNELAGRVKLIREAYFASGSADETVLADIRRIEKELLSLSVLFTGDASVARREFEVPPSLISRIDNIIYNLAFSTSDPTKTIRDQYGIAGGMLTGALERLRELDSSVRALENKLEEGYAPYTPGRLPAWKPE
jgi:photosystem II stability/assembly factor-like uncharacterized protein